MESEPPEDSDTLSAFDVHNFIQSNNNLENDLLTDLNHPENWTPEPSSYQMFPNNTQLSPPATDASSSSPDMDQPQVYQGQFQAQGNGNFTFGTNYGMNPQYAQVPSNHGPMPTQPGPSTARYEPYGRDGLRYNDLQGAPYQERYATPNRSANALGVDVNEMDKYLTPEFMNIQPKLEVQESPQSSSSAHHSNVSSGNDFDVPKQLNFYFFDEEKWMPMCDRNENTIQRFQMWLDNVKNVEYGTNEKSFINYKKNMLEATLKVQSDDQNPPQFVAHDSRWCPIQEFKIEVNGVKSKSLGTKIEMRQSTKKRDELLKPSFPNIKLSEIEPRKLVQRPLGRLHFSEATENNKNPPNPNQEYFLFVVKLFAVTPDGNESLVRALASDPMIVRASNRGAFKQTATPVEKIEDEFEIAWVKSGNTIGTLAQVVIGRGEAAPNAALTVNGNLQVNGRIVETTYSTKVMKYGIEERKEGEAVSNMQQLVPVTYFYKPEYVEQYGLPKGKITGFIAEDVEKVLPDAVRRVGEFLTIDEKRICMECIMATVELSQMAEKMQEQMNANAAQIKEIIARGEQRRTGSIASGLNQGDRLSITSSRRRPDIFCSSKVNQWTVLSAVIVLMGIMAVSLVFMVYLYSVDLRARYSNVPNAPWPLNNRSIPPENMVVPVERLWHLQKDVSPLAPGCHGDHCHSYCCHHSAVPNNMTKYTIEDLKPSEQVHKSFLLSNRYAITLPLLNASIDSRFCIGASCQRNNGKYLLYVPLSPNLPPIPQSIRFMIPKGKIVQACGYVAEFQHRSCDNALVDTRLQKRMRKIDDTSFELPVGQLLQSAFGFRIGFTSEMCSLAKNSHNFDEIIIHFYRKCH